MNAVRSVIPSAHVSVAPGDGWPIKVTVTHDFDGQVVWEGAQRRLFRKYARERDKAVQEIKAGVAALVAKYQAEGAAETSAEASAEAEM